ncbi:DUF885 domain-containing protein [Undibacterium sp. FT79W]|uniref:DUF885 domain-containing protein n=1 Tax=Undibacterium sp. FT79W TaxID=2762296 RepID=UPI00164CC506|nr:DUF885 domain-containing protein [Undibacterium sp. FT79W]MBC3877192.1 DUF885 domain-containing protein [Undibacterium sp. FT79W]
MLRRSISLTVLALSISCLGSEISLTYAQDLPSSATAPTRAKHSVTAAKKLAALAERYYEIQAKFEPIAATYNGDSRYDDKLPQTLNPAIKAKQIAQLSQISKALSAIRRNALSTPDQVTYDCLQFEIAAAIRMSKFDDRLMPVNQMDNVPLTLAHFASGQSAQLLKTVPQYDNYLNRIRQLPEWLQQASTNMREGMRRKIVLPKTLVISMLPQFAQLVTDQATEHPYYLPVKNFPGEFTEADKLRLSKDYQSAIQEQVLPALRRFNQFLKDEYLPASRDSTGWSALPGGAQWYQAWVEDQTTTRLTPEQIHATGLKEVARIQREYAILGPKLGYQGKPESLPEWMEAQTSYRPFKTEKEVLDAYIAIDGIVRQKLPEFFEKTPKAALEIRPEPEISRATASDHYTAPAIDGSRPGVFWAVINKPEDYATTGMKTLFLHEGQPGHHFHLATLQELDVPKFRKVGGNNAYTEGWALYAETLGREMGLFENDPAAYYGHLSDEMLRATRLVVDTGMHAKGWTREQGIQYLQQTLGYSEAVSRQCIERYMAWPGQALGYKIGSLKIMELRQKAQAALGDRFDLRRFHNVVLSDGTLPLSLLETKVLKWINDQKQMK